VREPYKIVIPMALFMVLFIYMLFDWLLAIPWPGSYLGDYWLWWKTNMPSA
jgi:hypothetical protein